jgi:hypothetical protein
MLSLIVGLHQLIELDILLFQVLIHRPGISFCLCFWAASAAGIQVIMAYYKGCEEEYEHVRITEDWCLSCNQLIYRETRYLCTCQDSFAINTIVCNSCADIICGPLELGDDFEAETSETFEATDSNTIEALLDGLTIDDILRQDDPPKDLYLMDDDNNDNK